MSARRLGFVFVALTTLLTVCTLTQSTEAQAAGRIKLIVPYPPGGLPDTVARFVGRRLQERLHQSVVVENRPGANGGIAVNALINSPADGQTFVVSDGAILSINPQVYSKLSYDPNEIAPAALLAQAPLFLAIHQKLPVSTMKEFIEYVRDRPDQLTYGSSGVGSIHHISMEGLKSALQLKMLHVPFKGTGESVPALLGGHVDSLFSAYPSLSGADQSYQAARKQRPQSLLSSARLACHFRDCSRIRLRLDRGDLCPSGHIDRDHPDNWGGSDRHRK